ncbi:hypothetical protein Gohar_027322 [Gossypium harknessii]|uniref:Endonuclease/exonuclease/phosphatase domain-containing protein n=1 Tax=Gossypium harknessii TaxID=34285 RepID=A0A7J9HUH0_9ROSI|nr:hypothetical protein [Gossypium harknessii]
MVDFNPSKPFLSVVLTWIRFSGLPGFLYNKQILEEIRSLVRKVTKLGEFATVAKRSTPTTSDETFGPWNIVKLKSRQNQDKARLEGEQVEFMGTRFQHGHSENGHKTLTVKNDKSRSKAESIKRGLRQIWCWTLVETASDKTDGQVGGVKASATSYRLRRGSVVRKHIRLLRILGFNTRIEWRQLDFGCPNSRKRRHLWGALRRTNPRDESPWMVIGDFNTILSSNEKRGGWTLGKMCLLFGDFMDSTQLYDLGFEGSKFIWQIGGIVEHLDRAIFNSAWNVAFPNSIVTHLPRLKSDHRP